jgi:hypothetical protein
MTIFGVDWHDIVKAVILEAIVLLAWAPLPLWISWRSRHRKP